MPITDLPPDLELRDKHPDPLQLVVETELQNVLWRTLTTREKQVFEVRYLEYLSPDDVAARLGMKRNTVYVHLGKIRAKLEVILRA